MAKRIPIKSVKQFAKDHQCKQVIVAAWDGRRTHIATYGETVEDCDQAAQGGNKIKEALGWPKDLSAEPSRVRVLQAENRAARQRIGSLEEKLRAHGIAY